MIFKEFDNQITINANLIKIFGFVICLFVLLPWFVPAATHLCEVSPLNIGGCLDPSWALSVSWALEKNFIFGKDFVFTYGPLGFLATRIALNFNYKFFLIFDVFVLANFGFILMHTLRRFPAIPGIFVCLLFSYTIAGSGMYMDQIVFTLLIISIFWLNYSLKKTAWVLIIPILITTLLFFIKVNVSLVALLIFYIYLGYSIISIKEQRLHKLGFALLLPILIILISIPLNTYLFGYLLGSLSLIDGYNDAMGIKLGNYFQYLLFAILIIFTYLLTFYLKNWKQNLLLLLTSVIVTFILFKQSFVRSDLHIVAFFLNFPLLIGVLTLFFDNLSRLHIWVIICLCCLCLFIGLYLDSYPNLGGRIDYLRAMITSRDDLSQRYNDNFNRFPLPKEVLNIIGNESVDIIPWNIDYLYFNRLNYNPRPVIQSYSVYTPYLMDLNREKYESDTAPSFVIFSNQTIDGRYAFFDDQEVKLSLLRNYICLGKFGEKDSEFLLFQRKPENAKIEITSIAEKQIHFGQIYDLEDINKSYFIKINANYSILGKAIRFVYKPFPITITFLLNDGTERQNRAIVSILKNGVLINPLIENEEDFERLSKGEKISNLKQIKGFKIDLDNPSQSAAFFGRNSFEQDISLSIYEINIHKEN